MNIASVILKDTTREFDKHYHYSIPENMISKVLPGMRVMVPFGAGNRLMEGYIFDIVGETDLDIKMLKDIRKVIDKKPVLTSEMCNLSSWMKDKYICTHGDAIKCMLPSGIGIKSRRIVTLLNNGEGLRKNQQKIVDFLVSAGEPCEEAFIRENLKISGFASYIKDLESDGIIEIKEVFSEAVKDKHVKAAFLKLPEDEVQSDIEGGKLNRIQHIRILELLMDSSPIPVGDLARFAGVSPGVLNTLSRYGYIGFINMEVNRDPYSHVDYQRTFPHEPTREQADVLDKLYGIFDKGVFSEALIHGVTGSGKTEIYMQLIQRVIDSGRQAIVLVPEISLTPQMVDRFKGRFGDQVAVQHSRLSLGERYDQWHMIKSGRIKVTVGARSAVFAPFDNLGTIIIDEEHESSYKSERTPKYHAADVARERCRKNDALLISGSATPSVDTYYRAENNEILKFELSDRTNNMQLPAVHAVDMRKELEEGNRSPFSEKLKEEIIKNINNNEQTILFINRRGYSSFVLCRSCGFTLKCRYCSISLTFHSKNERLICHHCGYTEKMPETCPKCESTYIRQFGMGTQKVEEDLKKHLPGSSVIRMDMDTTTGKNSHERILREFREKNINILVGTQMIAKGHDFPKVTLVGVLAADSLLNMDDYRATERTFQLLTQVSGRAGRDVLPGRVVIQTYNTEDFSIKAACEHDYKGFFRQEILSREKLLYPPFISIGTIIIASENDRLAFDISKKISLTYGSRFTDDDGMIFLGTMRAPIPKIKNKYRWRIIIKSCSKTKLLDLLTEISDNFKGLKGKRPVQMSVDIDPFNML